MTPERIGPLVVSVFSAGIVALVVWITGGPLWSIAGFAFMTMLLAAIAEDHAHR